MAFFSANVDRQRFILVWFRTSPVKACMTYVTFTVHIILGAGWSFPASPDIFTAGKTIDFSTLRNCCACWTHRWFHPQEKRKCVDEGWWRITTHLNSLCLDKKDLIKKETTARYCASKRLVLYRVSCRFVQRQTRPDTAEPLLCLLL